MADWPYEKDETALVLEYLRRDPQMFHLLAATSRVLFVRDTVMFPDGEDAAERDECPWCGKQLIILEEPDAFGVMRRYDWPELLIHKCRLGTINTDASQPMTVDPRKLAARATAMDEEFS